MAEPLTLVLRLDAPFQSWGTVTNGRVRDTQTEPTFSAVVGLISNALGRTRDHDNRDLTDLEFGTRTDRAGVITRDYYTAGTTTGVGVREEMTDANGRRTFKDTVSKDGAVGVKYYLSGAAFTVGLSGEESVLRAAHDALLRPARPLFLGRKSCPVTRPPAEEIVQGSLEQVLRTYPLDPHLDSPDAHLRLVLPAQYGTSAARPRNDFPVDFLSRQHRSRAVRIEHVALADVLTPKEARLA